MFADPKYNLEQVCAYRDLLTALRQFATDLKTIYQAADEKKALAALERGTEKWTPKYPNLER